MEWKAGLPAPPLVLGATAATLGLALAALCGAVELEALPGAEPFPDALRARLEAAFASESGPWRTRHVDSRGGPRYTNRLLLAASPYLRQHAHNPVDWHPWGEDAFAKARKGGRPIFVSVGYATCHGCHVMEEESFDDLEVAELLNAHFIAIKVDCKTRPDVAEGLARFVRAMQVQPGWPLHVFLTPDGQPFHGATFIPRRDRPGRPGILTVLASAARAFESEPVGLVRRAERLEARVRADLASSSSDAATDEPGVALIRLGVEDLLGSADIEWGGIAGRPKSPLRPSVRLLLREHRRTGDARALETALRGLERMARGAVRDPLGGGFHRLAEDRRWRVPHFEKTLADNAALALAYLEAWQVTGRAELADVVRETLRFLTREMATPEGGFHTALDAESRDAAGTRRAGAFYTWTADEVRAALPPELAQVALAAYSVAEDAPPAALHRERSLGDVARELDLSEAVVVARLEQVRAGLARARAERPAPPVDDQVLTGWNALAVSAFARAGFALEEPGFLRQALRTADFLLDSRREDGRLSRARSAGRSEGPALLEDYALLIAGLLDLSEVDPDPRWLREAVSLQSLLDRDFAEAAGGYTRSARGSDSRLLVERPVRDGAIPAGNAVAAMNRIRLHALTGDSAHRESAGALFRSLRGDVEAAPSACSELLVALDAYLHALHEVVIVHPKGVSAEPLIAVLRRSFVPNRVLLVVEEGEGVRQLAPLASLAARRKAIGGRSTAYVCRDHVCAFPTDDPEVFAEQLGVTWPLAARASGAGSVAGGR